MYDVMCEKKYVANLYIDSTHSIISCDSGDYDQLAVYTSKLNKAKYAPIYPLHSSMRRSDSSRDNPTPIQPMPKDDSMMMQHYALLTARVFNNITISFTVLREPLSEIQTASLLLNNMLSMVDELDHLFEQHGHMLPSSAPIVVTASIAGLLTDLMWKIGDKDAATKWAARHLEMTQHPIYARGLMSPFRSLPVLHVLQEMGNDEMFAAQVKALQPFKDLTPAYSTLLTSLEEVAAKRTYLQQLHSLHQELQQLHQQPYADNDDDNEMGDLEYNNDDSCSGAAVAFTRRNGISLKGATHIPST